ncbi:MAG: phosphate ABC transporter substrate-binding protein [Hapalosiphonaceae cyanobacterium JJU2]|nr:MAG: phosphate ABC transporter substrate-binding protein [Hapalosiphonaceae cyanobacterium JJU2]
MTNERRRGVPLSRDAVQIVRGLVVGELITIIIIGGLWLWLRPRLQIDNGTFSRPMSQGTSTTSSPSGSTFQTITNVPIGSFKHGGSTAWASIRPLVNAQIQNLRPELQLSYVDPTSSSPGSGSGIQMLLDGKLDFVESSRPPSTAEQEIARQRGFKLASRQVAIDGIAIAVNPSLQVSGLTVEQLQQIYLGKITNWKQLGGPDLAITAFSQRPESADTVIFGDKQIFNQQTFGSNIQYVYSPTEAVRRLNQTPGSIYYAAARTIVPQCRVKLLTVGLNSTNLVSPYIQPPVLQNQCPQQRNQVNTEAINDGSYPIITKLYVITKQNNSQQQQAGEAYTNLLLTDQGQQLIQQAGLVPMR